MSLPSARGTIFNANATEAPPELPPADSEWSKELYVRPYTELYV